ncbi:MAG: phosphoribosylamine--glycine ligase [Deltaproteobacteria bacterium]|nr:phosphoribosylamine--glycine ligase [Deltaproteobacteria bacterium]MBW2401210.1 phosphoribosylamine--glycine ligase [Deltaproteobacteria bacterium]MBW2666118.1 phosphoribosylamine--glycine ligase [Deltaproteobacteria bacterium]
MRVLVLGSGGREHALAWKIAHSPLVSKVLAAPGSDGMSAVADLFPDVPADDTEKVLDLAQREAVDLVVVGPEVPLANGIADRLRAAGVAVFGPDAAAAKLEASKAHSKNFMARHDIPTAAFEVFDDLDAALSFVREKDGPCVVKADGLAAGKGVAVCATRAEAESALREIMGDRRFGAAGERVVIEDLLEGEEVSYYAITDGEHIVTLAAAQDHKRALDGDRGENTGGMGAYSPAPVLRPEIEKRVIEEVVFPAIRGLAAEGTPYVGVLFVGLMIAADGAPSVVEFNVRFGDPETQPLMMRLSSDIVPLLDAAARGRLDSVAPPTWGDASVCVVLASGGYPREFRKGIPIRGLDAAAADPDVEIFHAGTRRNQDGVFETSGGRVLGITARGATVREAVDRAYAAADRIEFDGRQLRRDIAARALSS